MCVVDNIGPVPDGPAEILTVIRKTFRMKYFELTEFEMLDEGLIDLSP